MKQQGRDMNTSWHHAVTRCENEGRPLLRYPDDLNAMKPRARAVEVSSTAASVDGTNVPV